MKTIIAGSRSITNYKTVVYAVSQCGWVPSAIVSGCAPGVDTLGEEFAKQFNLPIHKYPADWNTQGRAAGPIRNRQMGDNADALIAIWDGKSPGTGDMIKYARQKGLKVFVHIV